MSNRDFVAISVSGVSKEFGVMVVENVYLVETVDSGDPIASATLIAESRLGARIAEKEVVYELITEFPEIIERNDVTWLTPRRTDRSRRDEPSRREASRPAFARW